MMNYWNSDICLNELHKWKIVFISVFSYESLLQNRNCSNGENKNRNSSNTKIKTETVQTEK